MFRPNQIRNPVNSTPSTSNLGAPSVREGGDGGRSFVLLVYGANVLLRTFSSTTYPRIDSIVHDSTRFRS